MAAWSGQRFCKGVDEFICLKTPSGVSKSFCDLSHGLQYYSFFVPLDFLWIACDRQAGSQWLSQNSILQPGKSFWDPETSSSISTPNAHKAMPHNSLGVPPYSLAYFFLSCTAYKDLIYSAGLGQTESLLAFCYSIQWVHWRITKCLMGNNLKLFTSRHTMYYWCSRSCWILNQVSRKSWDTHLFQLDVSSIGNVLPPQRLLGQMAPANHLTPCMCFFSSILKLTGFWSILPCMFIQLTTHCLVPSRSQKKKSNKQTKIPNRVFFKGV